MIELPSSRYALLLPSLQAVPINHLFARSVLERQVDGRVWVDAPGSPGVHHVLHPYGMSLVWGSLAGANSDALANHFCQGRYRTCDEWLQVDPRWKTLSLERLLGIGIPRPEETPEEAHVQRYTRVNFKFDRAAFEAHGACPPISGDFRLRPMTVDEFTLPDISVSPHHFWRDADQFLSHGGGWCVEQDGEICAIAFSCFRHDAMLEIGIETKVQYRGRGLAGVAAAAIIAQCLATGLEPVWSCRKENVTSLSLATRMGFTPTLELPYYRLPASATGNS